MAREKFVENYLERLITKDIDISERFRNAVTPNERKLLEDSLRISLERSYDSYAKNYFDSKGLGSYLSTFLRSGGLLFDGLGTYTFWSLGPAGVHIAAPAAAGMKGVGLVQKSLADLIDGHHYAKHAKTEKVVDKVKDASKIGVEAIVERAVAYTPFTFGVGEITDFVRGKSKYDKKVTSRALQYAKSNFLDRTKPVGTDNLRIMPISHFKNPAYSPELGQSLAV